MIVSRRCFHGSFVNLEGYYSRLSGPIKTTLYFIVWKSHRLYGRNSKYSWYINGDIFTFFKSIQVLV